VVSSFVLELAAEVKTKRSLLITVHCSLNTVGTFPLVSAAADERGMKEKE
jgi:hypothetical protein